MLTQAALSLADAGYSLWGSAIAFAVASFLLGGMLIAGLPGTALWALGLFLGINLISSGLSFVALAKMP